MPSKFHLGDSGGYVDKSCGVDPVVRSIARARNHLQANRSSSSGSSPGFESRFSHGHVFHQMSQQLRDHRHLDISTPLRHAPLTLTPSATSEDLLWRRGGPSSSSPGHTTRSTRGRGPLSTVPERRLAAGSSPAAVVPTLFGVPPRPDPIRSGARQTPPRLCRASRHS